MYNQSQKIFLSVPEELKIARELSLTNLVN